MSESESEKFTSDTPNDIISPGGSDGGEISPLNARVKRTWTHSHQSENKCLQDFFFSFFLSILPYALATF